MTTQPVDSSILHEIVRVIESRRKVPEKVIVKSKEYVLTYLEDHQRRLEEALTRYDGDRLNMPAKAELTYAPAVLNPHETGRSLGPSRKKGGWRRVQPPY